MILFNILSVMLMPPWQLVVVILLSVLFIAAVAGNILLYFYLRNRGARKLCTHQLQNKRDELLQQLNLLRAGEFVGFEENEEEEDLEVDEMLLVDEEEDDDDEEEKEQLPIDRHSVGVVAQEEVDETMDAEILYVERTSAKMRDKLGLIDREYDKKRYYVRYSMGFEAKLRCSAEDVKERYVELMNEIASYAGLKVKGSYRQQRIFKGRKTLGLLMFRGKTLCIALALNPADYEETKFRGIDKSGSRRFEKTPMLMKVTSQRKLEYVKYLLIQLAEINTIMLAVNHETLTFDLTEKTREELYLENKLQIAVLGEVPDSVPYEEPELYDEEEPDEDDEENGVSIEEFKRYNRSYTARIIQADEELKARYSEIKNHIVSYRGVFNSITWKREAFYANKRDCFATFAVRGKTLCLFLSSPASRFDGTKYKVEDRTQQVRNAKMPTMFRIKSDRGTKYAKELIDLVMGDKGVKMNDEYKPVNYRPAYRSTENLIRNGYIRVKTTQVVVEEPLPNTKKQAAATTAKTPAKKRSTSVPKTKNNVTKAEKAVMPKISLLRNNCKI